MAKLVDARDLKSLGLARAGSTPAVRTILLPEFLFRQPPVQFGWLNACQFILNGQVELLEPSCSWFPRSMP